VGNHLAFLEKKIGKKEFLKKKKRWKEKKERNEF